MKKNQNLNVNTKQGIVPAPFTKIFNSILNGKSKTINLKSKVGVIGNMKYLPSFAKEWKNIIYSYNKNNLKNLPVNNININKLLQSYFNLFFKNSLGFSKLMILRKRRTMLRKIFVSDAEIKHTNDKVKITLYTINREKKNLKEKYIKLYKKMSLELLERYIFLYKNYIINIYSHLIKKNKTSNEYFFERNKVNKKNYIIHKFNYLGIFLKLNNLLLKKIWSLLIRTQSKGYVKLLRKYNMLYSLNHFKLNKLTLLPKLSSLLTKITGKKIDYNIINLKSISYSTDIFTRILALKIKKTKMNHVTGMLSVLNKAYLPKVNTIQERTKVQTWDNLDVFQNKFKNLNVISNINNVHSSTALLESSIEGEIKTSTDQNRACAHDIIYNSIKYKNISGIEIQVKGRLTKRYRADRSVFSLKRKGGLKNIDSSFKGLSSILFRGNTKSNVNYSLSKSKRRVGAFAVKGWIGGK